MSHDRDLDKLYQLPLGEFTVARNELAKSLGAKGGAVKSLEKPSVSAWAINQLYWSERRVYDKLIRASERVRAGHAQLLHGKKADLATLEGQHSAAVKEAAELVRALLAKAGDAATPATMKSVVDTLQALPGGSEPGRLAKALAPMGFGAFGALMQGGVSAKALAEVVRFAPPKPKADELAEAARRATEAARARLRELEAQSKKINASLAAARVKAEKAEAARVEAEARLQTAAVEARRLAGDVSRLESEARAADQERARLADDLSRK